MSYQDTRQLQQTASVATGARASHVGLVAEMTRTYQATVVGTGAVSATVVVEVSNDGEYWLTLGTITLSGTTSDSDGFASNAAWAFVRSDTTAISGTGATVTVTEGYYDGS